MDVDSGTVLQFAGGLTVSPCRSECPSSKTIGVTWGCLAAVFRGLLLSVSTVGGTDAHTGWLSGPVGVGIDQGFSLLLLLPFLFKVFPRK